MCWKKRLIIPYPEEKPDYSQTIDNISIASVISKWFANYHVPTDYHGYWRTKIEIIVDPNYQYPTGVWEENGVRKMRVRPEYLNAGVIAHEQAHNSYALLSYLDKEAFGIAHSVVKETDPLVKLLYRANTYGLTNDVEGHAEIYRYLGDKMPELLKQYYPKLF